MKTNVLIFPFGSENSYEIYESLRFQVNFNIHTACSQKENLNPLLNDTYKDIPFIQEEHFLVQFNEYLIQNQIEYIFPTHDSVVWFFAENQNLIKAQCILPSLHTAKLCRYKSLCYEYFKDEFFAPIQYFNINDQTPFPLIAKPSLGEGGKQVALLKDFCAFQHYQADENTLFVEYLPLEEVTVDCLSNQQGELIFHHIRLRKKTQMGIATELETLVNTDLEQMAQRINAKCEFKGLWYFQAKKNQKGQWKLLEISARCPGSLAHTRGLGVNLPLLTLYIFMNYEVNARPNFTSCQLYRNLSNQYTLPLHFNSVFIDYDDTIILGERVNSQALAFIYQCQNLNIPIFLISKHEGDLLQSLTLHKIDPNLFTQIFHLALHEEKSTYIHDSHSIFIDNSHREREKMAQSKQIPVFDVDMIPYLLPRNQL